MGWPDDLVDRVAAIVREVSAAVIEPRFGALADHERHDKAPGEVVTVADTEAEALLTRRLQGLTGGLAGDVPVVGEEACAADPALVDALLGARAWIVDPIDGTANFATGSADWAVMVALVEAGQTVASWIWRPVAGAMYVAERGSGAHRNGEPVVVSDRPIEPGRLRGAVLRRFLDHDQAAAVERNRHSVAELRDGRGCAGVEYPAIIEGHQDFVVFWRTLPWDHAPGALLIEEAGGVVARPDGSSYRPGDASWGLVAGANAHAWHAARALLP